MEIVQDLQPIQKHSIGRTGSFATRVSNLAAFLQSTDSGDQHIGNDTMMEELTAKLLLSKSQDWASHVRIISGDSSSKRVAKQARLAGMYYHGREQ